MEKLRRINADVTKTRNYLRCPYINETKSKNFVSHIKRQMKIFDPIVNFANFKQNRLSQINLV